jgi:hypothetical protein
MNKKDRVWKKFWQSLIQRVSWVMGSQSQVYNPNLKPLSKGKGKKNKLKNK